ncbi:uncharacterized protein LOC110634023 isoform X2 [Hevea brasiliensis]|uniref:uncharacterized protein LOC110634023 isoform X2 n=1 Tax=Hevea brasiliensis TaxID=3981 RepID=UPI0025CFA813|nr:uncharacterized protein LOC110634023 isoform X2 [Hevea brasiliensis]
MENIIILGVISWATTFLLIRKLLPNRSFEFCNRLVSSIHAILAVTLASLSVEDWRCPACPLASKPSSSQRFNLDNTIHHLVSIVGLGAGLAYQKCGSELVTALWMTEMSSPFLHLRELLKELGYRDTALNLAADMSFAIIFSFARMVAGPYLTYVTIKANNPLVIKVMALGLQLVSAFWFFKIVRMIKYKVASKTKTKSKESYHFVESG